MSLAIPTTRQVLIQFSPGNGRGTIQLKFHQRLKRLPGEFIIMKETKTVRKIFIRRISHRSTNFKPRNFRDFSFQARKRSSSKIVAVLRTKVSLGLNNKGYKPNVATKFRSSTLASRSDAAFIVLPWLFLCGDFRKKARKTHQSLLFWSVEQMLYQMRVKHDHLTGCERRSNVLRVKVRLPPVGEPLKSRVEAQGR